jgi:hypothetical protein
MGMFSQIKGAVNSILPSLYDDDELAIDITWRKFTGSVFNETTGVNEETYTESTVRAIRIEKETQGMTTGRQSGGVPITVGDVAYLFKGPDIPDGASTRDIIVDSGYAYAIDKIVPVFGLVTKVEVRGYA